MITILLFVFALVFIPAVSVLVLSVVRAPEGYEDESGFHSGKIPVLARTYRKASKKKKTKASVLLADVHIPAA